MNVGHIAGPINIEADGLSRWDGNAPPHEFRASDRFRISLSDLWLQPRTPIVDFRQMRICCGDFRDPNHDSLSLLEFKLTLLLGFGLAS